MTQLRDTFGKNCPLRILITMGDPAGIGPEIICKVLRNKHLDRSASYAIVGLQDFLNASARCLNTHIQFEAVECPDMVFSSSADAVSVFEPEGLSPFDFQLGVAQASCGEAAFRCITASIDMAMRGQCDAVVTAPICKESIHMAGHNYPGHTEIFTELTGSKTTALMLIAGRFRVIHVTNHMALRDTAALITRQHVFDIIDLANDALTRIDNGPPRLAVASYNPHAGEGGLFGREEIEEIEPAIREAQRRGIDVMGPLPPDSLFPQLIGGRFDGVVAMYHDQGHIAFKLHNFHYDSERGEWDEVAGVNVTLGLPIVRTSVDHGTAFDLAGTGKASERSLLDAIDLARLLVERAGDRDR